MRKNDLYEPKPAIADIIRHIIDCAQRFKTKPTFHNRREQILGEIELLRMHYDQMTDPESQRRALQTIMYWNDELRSLAT